MSKRCIFFLFLLSSFHLFQNRYPYLTAIIPDNDLVPLADFQKGLIQNIPCTADIRTTSDHIKCHSADRTLATLLLACPDINYPNRKWGFYKEKIQRKDIFTALQGKGGTPNDVIKPDKCPTEDGLSKDGKQCTYWSKEAEEHVPSYNIFDEPPGWGIW